MIEIKGYKKKSYFVDGETGEHLGNYCRCCATLIRAPSNRWPYSLYKHTLTKKHIKNNI